MADTGVYSNEVHELGNKTLANAHLQEAYRSSTLRLYTHRLEAVAEVPGWERLRERAQELKRQVMEHLDFYLEQFADNMERRGGKVHWAATAEDACRIVLEIAQQCGAREIVKAKSMLGEEVELNHALEARGIRPFETDLGEFIIQLAGNRPAHIVAPAIHMTRHDISDLFATHLHSERTAVPERLTAIARQVLREKFARAGMGMSGANFLVAETGTVVLVENEGNIRFCTTAPRVHVALVGIEKTYPAFCGPRRFPAAAGAFGHGTEADDLHLLPHRPAAPG